MSDPDPVPLESTLRLVCAAQEGDPDALGALFQRYLPRVRRAVGARLRWPRGRLRDADDLVQEALLKALKSLPGFDVESDGKFWNPRP